MDVVLDPDALFSLNLEEGTGEVAFNGVPSASDGQLKGGASYSADTPDESDYSLYFDGNNDYINLGTFDAKGSGLTLATWFKADSFPGNLNDGRLISKATGSAANDHVFMLSTFLTGGKTRLRARVRVNGTTQTLIADAGNLSTGKWYHATMTHDENTLKLFLDGDLVGIKAVMGELDQASNVPVVIAAQPQGAGSRYFHGKLDVINILQRALSPDEVTALSSGNLLLAGSPTDSVPTAPEGAEDVVTQPESDPEVVAEVTDPLVEAEESNDDLSAGSGDGVVSVLPSVELTQTNPANGAVNLDVTAAFPGALGWAAETTTGGRGGRVVIVDTLSNAVNSDDGVTSFREAMTEINEPRIIVFSVAGLIDYRSGSTVPDSTIRLNDSDSDVTIACQSAPSPGVTLMGDGINFSGYTNNVIMRHCRFRNSDPTNVGSAENSSCIRATGTSPNSQGEVQKNFIIDNVSCMWAADDPITFSIPKLGGDTAGNIENITISNSIVSEGDADSLHDESGRIPDRYTHSMGPSCSSSSTKRTVDRCSMARNFMAHNGRRNGRFWAVDEAEAINNIIYNPNEVGISAKQHLAGHIDAIISGNLIQLGPTSKSTAAAKAIDLLGNNAAGSRIAISGNYLGQYRANSVEPYNNPLYNNSNTPRTQQVTPSLDILEMSRQGSDHLRCVGASRPHRDSHDARVIKEFHQQTGQVGVLGDHERDFSEYPKSAVRQSWADTDSDGMPDSWESKMGVNNANGKNLSQDYTNLEVFLNRMALCPSIVFESANVSLPSGTRKVDVPFTTTWETWEGGQTFEVCIDNECDTHHNLGASGTFTATIPSDGVYQFTMTPVSADGVLDKSIEASLNLKIGQD